MRNHSVTFSPEGGILLHMTEPDPHVHGDTVAQLAAVGIRVTDEGRARARRLLADARARRTPERRDALRRQLGIAPVAAASSSSVHRCIPAAAVP